MSLANVVDIAGNSGLSAFKLGRFLERVGSRWCPLNMNPVAVAEAERKWRRGELNPSFGWGFIKAYVSEATAPVSLREVVRLTRGTAGQQLLAEHDQQASELRGHVLAARQLLASKTTTLARMFPPQVFDKARPTRFIYDRLLAGVLKNSFTFTNNDVTDLLHTAVPLAYADLVVLDKGWAEQSRQALTAARNAGHEVEVFKVGQLDAFLDAFDAWEPSRRRPRTA